MPRLTAVGLGVLLLVASRALAGPLYVTDTNLSQPGFVVRVNPATGSQAVVSSGGQFVDPGPIAIDPNGNLIVGNSDRILRVNPTTGAQTVVSSGGLFITPLGPSVQCLAVAANGDIIVGTAGQGFGGIVRINPTNGAQSYIATGGFLYDSNGLAIAANGDIIVANNAFFNPDSILRINPTTGAQTIVTQSPFANSDSYANLAIAANGDLLVPDGRIFAGAPGVIRVNPVTGAQTIVSQGGFFSEPNGLILDTNGSLLVVDRNALGSGAIIRVNPVTGAQTVVSCDGLFRDPVGIVMGADLVTVPLVTVPEPSTLALFGTGAAGLFGYAWRRRKAGRR